MLQQVITDYTTASSLKLFIRRMKTNKYVLDIADRFSTQEILSCLEDCLMKISSSLEEEVMPYVYLAALNKQNEIIPNEDKLEKLCKTEKYYEFSCILDLYITDYKIVTPVFEWLCSTYVQRSDNRQKTMGLQYTAAETHDLAYNIAYYIEAEIRRRINTLKSDILDDIRFRFNSEGY